MDVLMALDHGKGRSAVGSGSELINGFAQAAPKNAKDQVFITGTPGTAVFSTIASLGAVLRLQPAFNQIVAFMTTGIYTVDQFGTATRIGDALPGPVSSAYNGIVVVAVNGRSGVVIDGSTVAAITDPDFVRSDTVVFQLGFFVFQRAGSGQYFITSVYSTDIDALDFATAESAPDDTVAVVALRRELWLMGEQTVEVHGAQAAQFPFAALTGVSIPYGCVAPFSAIKVSNSVLWLSPDGIVFQSLGYEARRISTHEIEEELTPLRETWADAYAWTYIEDGHEFYLLTVGENTFVFDMATRLWHKRRYKGLTRHIATACCTAFGKVLIGDNRGRILHMSKDFLSDVDGDIVTIVGSLPYSSDSFFTTSSLRVTAEVGDGATALLEYSDDTDGKTWSNRIPASMGEKGEHDAVVEWRRLGRARSKRFRMYFFGPGRKRIGTTMKLEAA